METQQYAVIEVVVAVGMIFLAFLYRARGGYTSFRVLFLVGHMALVGGMMASGLVNVWIAGGVFALWFPVAGYFIIQERKERKEREQKSSGVNI